MYSAVKTGFRVEAEEGVFREYPFETKNELLNSPSLQGILVDNNSKDKKNFQKITCLCKPENHLYLSAKKSKSGKYYLANFPHNEDHHPCCPYHQDTDELVDDEGVYSDKIFVEPENYHDNSLPDEKKDILDTKNAARLHTFNNFCRDYISDAQLFAFHKANYNRDRAKLINPDRSDFISAVWRKFLGESDITHNKSIKDAIPENYYFEFGFIEEAAFNTHEAGKKSFSIPVMVQKSKNEVKKKYYSFTPKLFTLAKKRLTIFQNTITPPYFYIAIVKPNMVIRDGKKRYFNNVVRFFIAPVFSDEEGVVTIESNLEREYAKKLYEKKIPFIKPLFKNEPYRLKKGIFSYRKDEKERYFNLNDYRPDFIEFRDDATYIVEVEGYKDDNYQKELSRKIEFFKKESRLHSGRYKVLIARDKNRI